MRNVVLAAILAIFPMLAANAHHGWSSYDATREMRVEATLKDLRWANPHGMARVNWQRAEWDVVLAPVSRMEARGLTREMVEGGQTVTLIGYPRTDGTREMRIERLIVDGKTVELR
jgi:hypothetical protein